MTRRLCFVFLIGPVVALLVDCEDFGADFGDYEDFYRMGHNERRAVIQSYPLDQQLEIYLVGETWHSRSGVQSKIAENGSAIIPIIEDRLGRSVSDRDLKSIYSLLVIMELGRYYPVSTDQQLMALLTEKALAAHDEETRIDLSSALDRIRNSQEIRDSSRLRELRRRWEDINRR